ncbi:hypothetical protein RRG08_049411 [Elysia crispata]|uniref:Uncharacterized protein n=1 Tax=Elysia crispata TaxID=231223 RepID=A0AAE0ZS78_9GAST|nr:hypothetical protein RRG08_049411 [Elysia crispata]
MQHEATETRERGQMRPSSSTETRPAEPVKGEERREKAGIDLDSDHIHNSDTQQTAGRNVESTTSCLNSTANCLDLTQAVNTSAVVGSSHSGVETHGETGGKSTNVIPGVEHIFFEQELERMEDQHHGAPAGMDIVVLAVDNSKPSDMAFQCE